MESIGFFPEQHAPTAERDAIRALDAINAALDGEIPVPFVKQMGGEIPVPFARKDGRNRRRRKMSLEARERIAAAQRARWAKAKSKADAKV